MMLKVMILGPPKNSEPSFECLSKFVEFYAYLTVFYAQGVLKQSKEIILKKVNNASVFQVRANVTKIELNLMVQ